MKANISRRNNGELLPIAIQGQQLNGTIYHLPVKSAQVKSALLLAGLFANGKTTVVEKAITRDHTERMMRAFGAKLTIDDLTVTIERTNESKSTEIYVPGDKSSAASFLVPGAIVRNSIFTLY